MLPLYTCAARSVCWATVGTGGEIVHSLKYGGWKHVAKEMGSRMARARIACHDAGRRSVVIPVPLSPGRLRERGFNQSELLARAVGAVWRLPVWADVLARPRATSSQTRLSPEERAANVRGAFEVVPAARARLAGVHVILLDDVVTTGATLNACAAALHAAGATSTSYLTFGRAPAAWDKI